MQLANALVPMVISPSFNVILERLLHPKNAKSPIAVTVSGKDTARSSEFPLNASFPIATTVYPSSLDGIMRLVALPL